MRLRTILANRFAHSNRVRDMTKYSPLAVANWFLQHHASPNGVEHMKLQKLVYCAHGWWLAFKPEAILDEKPQVWRYGPVFSSLYHVLKPFGRSPILTPQSMGPFEDPAIVSTDDKEVAPLLEFVWKRYGHLSSFALSEMTHEKNSAWYKQAEAFGFEVPHGLEIPDEFVRSEFLRIYDDERSSPARGSTAA